jgi:alanine dehydrogenase
MLILSRTEVESLLDLDRLVDALTVAMVDLSRGRASAPPRVAAVVAERHAMVAAMPAYLPSSGSLATKLVSVFPENADHPTHQAIICCFDRANGAPLAVMDGTHVTATRTAAGSMLATRLLAREEGAGVVSVIGTGVQAHSHARAAARLPGVRVVQVAGRNHARAKAAVDELLEAGTAATALPSIEDAVRSADVVCAATHAAEPVVRRAWLRAGTHVNAVGYNTAGDGEVDVDTMRDALVVVESRTAALAAPPAGAVELARAIEAGAIDADRVPEIGEIAAGGRAGRADDDQLTLYKSVGVAVQDAAAAGLILDAAHARGVGTEVDV